jgi:hypothetical protein
MYELRLKCRTCIQCPDCDPELGRLLTRGAAQDPMRQTLAAARERFIDHPIWGDKFRTVSLKHLPTGAVESYKCDASFSDRAVQPMEQ